MNLREQLPVLAPTVVANMTSPILRAVAAQLDGLEGAGDDSAEQQRGGSGESSPAPATLVCSGLLPSELDAAAAVLRRGRAG